MSGLKRTKTLDIDYHKPDELQFESSHHVTRPIVADGDDDDSSSCHSEDDFAGGNDEETGEVEETPPEIQSYLETYGEARGSTSDALREWHRNYALQHPKEGDPPPADCQGGCHWKDMEFSTACMACLEASAAIIPTVEEGK